MRFPLRPTTFAYLSLIFSVGCTPVSQELVLQSEDGSTLMEARSSGPQSIPAEYLQDIERLARRTAGETFQLTEVGELISLQSFARGSTEASMDIVCGRIFTETDGEDRWAYIFNKYGGSVRRIFTVGIDDCANVLSTDFDPQRTTTVDGAL